MIRLDARTAVVFGDWHGDLGFAATALAEAHSTFTPDIYLHAGDFGFWPVDNEESWQPEYLQGLQKLLFAQDRVLLWVDGNHEEHDWLSTFPVENGIQKILPNIWHITRGAAVMLGDKKLVGLGGARSVDRSMRVLGSSWFGNEVISKADYERAIRNKSADLLLTHEAPDAPWISGSFDFITDLESREQRRFVRRAAENLNVKLVIHGHHHRRYTNTDYSYRIEGLGCNDYPLTSDGIMNNRVYLDLENL